MVLPEDGQSEAFQSGVAAIKAQYLMPDSKVDYENDKVDGVKRPRGMNRHRPTDSRPPPKEKVCPFVLNEQSCPYDERCRYQHDVFAYWQAKPPDLASACLIYSKFGHCRFGVTCRFASQHIDPSSLRNCKADLVVPPEKEMNSTSFEFRKLLMKRAYAFDKASVQSCPKDDVNFAGKLYLAPLTTLGNLPFRRLCVDFGAQVTCSEMVVAGELLKGSSSEWALVRRHPSEKLFGVQLCGSQVSTMSKAAQVLVNEMDVDFIDINAACPLDMVCEKGGGCMLMKKHNRLADVVAGMQSVMNGTPLTLKLRTGVRRDKNLAHDVVEVLKNLNVNMVMLHGRSRDQRYTKSADWDYINHCARVASPMPLFGIGDVLSFEDYNQRMEGGSVCGVAIGRAALIKPWIFKEILEQRHYDISATERLDILKTFVGYGLEHWGSDQEGVNRTRRFLLEWLSFLYRYIPVGLLERVPQKLNERPPRYCGRSDLETLMASPRSSDWVTLSEMLLGPVPENFQFQPKHRANAY